jgi:eukaryotic-like serine/threonine-protein kinase
VGEVSQGLSAHGLVDLDKLAPALAGRYAVERELGHGGMATVYLADDLRHHRKVAIKVLRPELGSLLGPDRFAREIRIAAGLTHPHILPLHDSGDAGGLLYYVMPYIPGDSLRRRLAREGQLPIDDAVRIVRQVAAALHHAHLQGVIHRDIKPENILLHEGEAVVADFGIALAAGAAAGERLTETGLMVGTPEYMSPEQAAGERALDARSDVYSLACVLYELLTGEPPHAGATARAVIARRFTEPAPRVRRVRPAVPPALEQALVRALAAAPEERFPTAAAFAEALGAAPAPGGAGPRPRRSRCCRSST